MSQTITHTSAQTNHQESASRITQVPSPKRELECLLTSAGSASLSDRGWIEITGPDRVRWLNGMVTNSVGDLASGAGCYTFILNAQGRIQGDGYIFAEPGRLLFQTAASRIPNLLALLDRFIIMDDVELADISTSRHGILLAGPEAPGVLHDLHLDPSSTAAPSFAHLPRGASNVKVVHAYSPLVPRFEIWSDEATISELAIDLSNHAVTLCSPFAVELLRIAEGTPLFGVDIRDRDLPQETGANRALHFAKGCYLGQEIVERIRSRGNVHRTFVGFHLRGGTPSAGLVLSVDDKPVGELTSVASLGDSPVFVGLGYIRREALVLGNPIRFEGGGVAEPAALPFDRAKIL